MKSLHLVSYFVDLMSVILFKSTFSSNKDKYSQKTDLVSNRHVGPGDLSFRANEAVRVMIHSPEDVPFINHAEEEQETLPWGSSFIMRFQITEITNDPALDQVPVDHRDCRFGEENPLSMYPVYSYSACVVECHAATQFEFCGCTHHLMPAKSTSHIPVCDINGLICLTNTSDVWRSLKTEWSERPGLVCDCMPSCTEQEYNILQKTQKPLTEDEDDDLGSKIVIQMESLPVERFSRNVVRTKLDLVVSMGGTAGLFLGASLLSTVEVIYFCCIRSRKAIQERIQDNKKKTDKDAESGENNQEVHLWKQLALTRHGNKHAGKQQVVRDIYTRRFNPFYYPRDYTRTSTSSELHM